MLVSLGCEAPDPGPPAPSAENSAGSASAPPREPAQAAATAIEPDGIGAARAGMTLGQIRDALGTDFELGTLDERFMVDLNGMPVVRGRDTLYYLVFPADELDRDESVPLLVVTDHRAVRTREGIGPGSTLAEPAAKYGQPRLSYSADDEMREYATFPRYHHRTVDFRVAPGESVLLAGRYEQEGAYGETSEFDGDARIMMVMVHLRPF